MEVFARISVSVKGYGNVTVRTRNGYYATPDPAPKGASGLVK